MLTSFNRKVKFELCQNSAIQFLQAKQQTSRAGVRQSEPLERRAREGLRERASSVRDSYPIPHHHKGVRTPSVVRPARTRFLSVSR
jgi:hypothetical protein